MGSEIVNAVTGAFGYTGKYITRELLSLGHRVITLTNHPDRSDPFGRLVKSYPYNFKDPEAIKDSLTGIDTLYVTYWIRFEHGTQSFEGAVENTKTLFRAAKASGVRRVVYVSISNPKANPDLPYFKGKTELEETLAKSGLSYAILRPTVIFGKEDILINNIAWLLRRLPVFAIPGSGDYQLQPIYVEDMAKLAIEAGQMKENITWDAVGPETYTFHELVETLCAVLDFHPKVVHVPPWIALVLSQILSLLVGDVLLTRDEITGLMDNLLVSKHSPRGSTSLKEWLECIKNTIGIKYASELKRHYKVDPN
jgi:NADH dehydrogenase